MRRAVKLSFVLLLFASFTFAQQTPEEQAVWKLEHNYWEFVKANDLTSYRNLWHDKFVGWPQSSAAPAHKDHITDWIAAYTNKGEKLQSYTIKEAASVFADNIVVTHYWITDAWSGEKEVASRITHTWIKTKDGWKIIGGMSAPVKNPVP